MNKKDKKYFVLEKLNKNNLIIKPILSENAINQDLNLPLNNQTWKIKRI